MPKVDSFNGITTYTGKHFRPFDPDPLAINMTDIAHALSQNNRWNGHTKHPLSVAQHSLNVFKYVDHHGGTHMEKIQGLMHDGSEAYIPDLASPLKRRMKEFQALEEKVWQAICKRFGIDPVLSDLVHEADLEVFRFEYHTLIHKSENPTLLIPHPKTPFRAESPDMRWEPTKWRHLFLERARQLEIYPVGE